jgi:hypothetical protein
LLLLCRTCMAPMLPMDRTLIQNLKHRQHPQGTLNLFWARRATGSEHIERTTDGSVRTREWGRTPAVLMEHKKEAAPFILFHFSLFLIFYSFYSLTNCLLCNRETNYYFIYTRYMYFTHLRTSLFHS